MDSSANVSTEIGHVVISSESEDGSEEFESCSSGTEVDADNVESQQGEVSEETAITDLSYQSLLRHNYKLLLRCLIVTPGLLFGLKSIDYMRDKIPQIRQQTTTELKVAELLNILDEVPETQQQLVFGTLLTALSEDGQEHVANIFRRKTHRRHRPISDKHYELLKNKKEELTQFLDPTYPLLAVLVRNGALNQTDEGNILSRQSYPEMSLFLVNVLLQKPDMAFNALIDALRITDQQHVVYILTGGGSERPLSRLRRKVLTEAREYLVRKIEIKHSTLVAKLISNGVLNEVDMLHIEAQEASEDKTGVLIDAIARKSQSAYDKFLQALKHKDIDQPFIAQLLEGLELRGFVNTKFKDDEPNVNKSKVIQIIRDKMKALISGNENDVKELTSFMEQNGFAVSDISEGSIHISITCFTKESLANLERLYSDKTLDKLFTQAFCPKFAEQGLESLTLHIAVDEFRMLAEAFRQVEADNQIDTELMLSELTLTTGRQTTLQQTPLMQSSSLPIELLELLLLRTFMLMFIDYYKSRYKTHEAIQLAYSTLAAVSFNLWQTMNGWPQSPTGHWFKHRLSFAVKFVCRPYVVSPHLQSSLSVSDAVFGITVCDNKLFVVCLDSNSILVFGPNNKQQTNIELKQMYSPTDIVSCTETQQLFVAGWSRDSRCVWRVSLEGRQVVKWLPNNSTTASQFIPYTLSVTSCRLLVTSQDNELLLYGADGVELKCVPLPDIVTSPEHAVETSRGTFIVSYVAPQPQVCEVNVDGLVTRVYCDQQQLSIPAYLSLDSDGRIFVADSNKHRVLLLNSETLKLERVLLDTQQHQLTQEPYRLCYTQQTQQLAVASLSGCVQLFTVR